MNPLNGTKTHPLSAHAVAVLTMIAASGPVPRQHLNPGLSNRLLREALVDVVELPSPFATHKGRHIAHLSITDAGRAVLGIRAREDGQPARPTAGGSATRGGRDVAPRADGGS